MNNATMDSPNPSIHIFIIFLVFFPVGGFFNCRNPPPIPKPAEPGPGILYVITHGDARIVEVKCRCTCDAKACTKISEGLFIFLNPNVASAVLFLKQELIPKPLV